ncbi:hypothetical protein G6Z86_07000 (plasmid) [Lactobacillus iners]|jgi:hypothetical protein|uniref:hypothetical protein n=1 Tax=Lactobacillus iners TaxID=147802 RepID=UPI0013E1D05F|nr:hypothetical protein [Lactobacillus iners]QIH28317.1 hypothetical protein G6Z86_07000 [Lactobacillus iners]
MERVRSFIASHLLTTKFFISMLMAYLSSKVVLATSLCAFAQQGDDSGPFSEYVDTTSDPTKTVAGIFNGFVAPLQTVVAVILVIATVVCGMKIAVSSMTGDPRTRTEAIFGIAFIIVGAVVVVHARAIVGMAANMRISH